MKKFIKSTCGASMVEFALIAPILFVLLFGIIEFGAVLYNQAVITNASREAARYVTTFYTNPANATAERPSCSQIQNYAVAYVKAHSLDFFKGYTPFVADNVKCCNTDSCSTTTDPYYNETGYAGYVDRIRIEYEYPFLVFGGLMKLINPSWSWSSITLRAQTAMRDENQNP